MTPDTMREIIREAIASPSVHNVQPARWHIDGESVLLLEDISRRLAVGDPTGHDAAISLGASAEGFALAASKRGLRAQVERAGGEHAGYLIVARIMLDEGGAPDPLADHLATRASWRGPFHAPSQADRKEAALLGGQDRTIVSDPKVIGHIAELYDEASYGFMRREGFRSELRHWMRLRKSHPRWARDGLNAAAMKLSGIEAWGAGLVLGPLFKPLAALGLTKALLAEKSSFAHAAGVVLFHHPRGEDPFESGRAFHRLWLEIEAAGFGSNVLAAIADDEAIASHVGELAGLPSGDRLVSAFRIGRRDGEGFAPARLLLEDVLVD
ncbi:hypothetical protein [Erythrobacter sp. HKB08]|uniref:hypothetical protein n=1 Tax=Erythrobacter sp. HKB08 TaxID=2502843 RepID=UPI0010091FD9|nr:hypothetical protein [Erythrobacter sp. HKB08]